jgi:hypothetical protein
MAAGLFVFKSVATATRARARSLFADIARTLQTAIERATG